MLPAKWTVHNRQSISFGSREGCFLCDWGLGMSTQTQGHTQIQCVRSDKNKEQAESGPATVSASHLPPHQQEDFCLDFFLLCFIRNKFSLISGLASLCFFLFFFLLAASRSCWPYSFLLPCAWRTDLWCFLLPLDVCLWYPLGKSSSISWPLSTSLLCLFALCFSAWDDDFFFLRCSSLLRLLCSSQGFFLQLCPPCFSSCHGVSGCNGRRPASCSSVKQISSLQYLQWKPEAPCQSHCSFPCTGCLNLVDFFEVVFYCP